jgi:formylglycine-generating enzyme required for sulfatase activity
VAKESVQESISDSSGISGRLRLGARNDVHAKPQAENKENTMTSPRQSIYLGGALLFVLAMSAVTSSADKRKFDDPAPRKDAILKLFAEEFVPITPGKGKFPESFVMGSEKGGRANEKPAHKVTLKDSFSLAKYEVTQELYEVVMGKNPARWQGARNSVEMVDFAEAEEFCRRATKELRQGKLIGAKDTVRLPSEAEWEYCCRAGTTTVYSFGDDVKELGKYAWFKDNAPGNDPPVGKKLPNAWGLYDMHGYVWEWCLDDWQADYDKAPSDGSARKIADAKDRVVRGGAYPDPAEMLRCAYRHHVPAESRTDTIGFRCVLAKE